MANTIPVRVALRIRPLIQKELSEGAQECLNVVPGEPQVYFVNQTEKAFTYDYVFNPESSQESTFNESVRPLINSLFKGYNVTLLAYGQTGSGKTYSVGTSYTEGTSPDDPAVGIIPRAVEDIFRGINKRTESDFLVQVSFIELYNEQLFDLLSPGNVRRECDLREDSSGGIRILGVTEDTVTSIKNTMEKLQQGSVSRTTGSTAMNIQSSRSHAVFTITLKQQHKKDGSVRTAKFNFVDLAGSERAKKTKATGERFKEGININMGLLSLGNVISALGEESGRQGHIPYRDSKLTRLLQDSLGGNSHTVMIACVSPADSNMEETMSTLRYADRARRIKNKPIINMSDSDREILRLREENRKLKAEMLHTKSGVFSGEVQFLKEKIQKLEEENNKLSSALNEALLENINLMEKTVSNENMQENMKTKLTELSMKSEHTFNVFNKTFDVKEHPELEEPLQLVQSLHENLKNLKVEQAPTDSFSAENDQQQDDSCSPAKRARVANASSEDLVNFAQIKTDFALRQAEMNKELRDLNKNLNEKEVLYAKMTDNKEQFNLMNDQHQQTIATLEEQIFQLEKERMEQAQALRNLGAASKSSKIAEQRRKKIQDLEQKIINLQQKLKEKERVLKMKEKSDIQAKNLGEEITKMKQARVKLVKQLKEDTEKFRRWKQQKEREVTQLKAQDRKRQFQLVKMERQHVREQNVLRQKMDEYLAINKRLKDAMSARQKQAKERAENASTSSRMKNWLQHELEVCVSMKEAKRSLDELLKWRKETTTEVNELKKLLQTEEDEEEKSAIREKISELDNNISLHSQHLQEMQQKVFVVGDAAKQVNWDNVH